MCLQDVFTQVRRDFTKSSTAANVLTVSVVVFGWPIFFGLQRGNIESILWPGLALVIFLYFSGRYTAAAAVLGIVGSVKLYPLILLGLFLKPLRLREIGAALLAAMATTFIALRVLEPDVFYAWREVRSSVGQWTLQTAADRFSLIVDHSCFGLIKQIHGPFAQTQDALHVYLLGAGGLAAALFLFRVLHLPRANQMLYLFGSMVFLPPTSYDYTLTNLLIPWAWLTMLCARSAVAGESLARWYVPFSLLGVLLAPLSFLPAQGAVRACCLLGWIAFAVCVPLPGAGTPAL